MSHLMLLSRASIQANRTVAGDCYRVSFHHACLRQSHSAYGKRFSSSYNNERAVRIIEVSPRDGLQNIKQSIPTATKIELIQRLARTGLQNIEATSFVSRKWVPQLADGADVMDAILPFQANSKIGPFNFPVLAPNFKGLENASKAGAQEIVVFASATEAFSKANQNCTIEEALNQAEHVTKEALKQGIKVRGVISCIFSDPFTGPTAPQSVLRVAKRFLDMGCYEVGLGDTLGVGTPFDTRNLLEVLLAEIPPEKLAGHFHDTYGQAIANISKAYEMGIRTFDSSVAGLGGCPYAPGAKGNVATEDVVYTLEKGGISTGIDLEKLIDVGQWISKQIGIPYGSRVGAALATKRTSATIPKPKLRRAWKVVQDADGYIVSRSGPALRITLNRPKNGNALTSEMLEGLTKLFRDVSQDPSVFHIVLDSKGKFFCTGMDLSGGTNTSDIDAESSYYSKVFDLYDVIDHVPQTTIALIDGPCFGGGVGLTFVCDARFVSLRARWMLSEVKIGVSPAVISKYIVREWGVPVAREAMLSGREITPQELLRIGAIHGITEHDQSLDEKLDDYLDQLAKCAPRSAAVNKELTRLSWESPSSESQRALVKSTFGEMMAPGSEGEYGFQNFQKKIRDIDWSAFWKGKSPTEGLGNYAK